MSSKRWRGFAALVLAAPATVAVTGTTAQAADTCAGVNVALGANIQSVVNANPAGTTYCLAAGVYQLTAPLQLKTGDTLWGAGPSPTSGTMLSGAIVPTAWTASGTNWYASGVLPAAYTDPNGQCENNVANLCRKSEDVFRNSTQLVRVGSLAELGPGKFFPDYAANRVYVRDNPTTATMRVSRTRTALPAGTATDVTVRGLGVRHFASLSQNGAVEIGTRWKVFSVDVSYNHALGWKMIGNDASFTASRTSYNGQLGGGIYRADRFTVANVEIDHNNHQGLYWVADWESGGIKITTGATGVIDAAFTHDNLGIGLWADGAAGDPAIPNSLEFRNSTITNNSADGVRFEISSNGKISGNTVTGNGCDLLGRRGVTEGGLYDGAGIDVNSSVNVEVSNNTVAGNHNAIGGQERQGRELHLQHLRVVDNTITSTRCANGFGLGLTGVVSNQKADRPEYWGHAFDAVGDNRFIANDYKIPAADGGLEAKRYAWNGSYMHKWSTWIGVDGQDAGGTAVVIP
ncbi:right-handed parallel beta-helix repeat-containing protein [Kribbella deserti]|uniref:Right-handed parallel beta-helix repeat-containing protein n=1 Tax=Kribbella deserti TaxID=1926257 RepID=A0ABV6QKE0_9ACTN